MIRAIGVGRRFRDKPVLRDVSFELDRGGFLVVTGPNGSGKSTLLRLCAGLLAPTEGRIEAEPSRGRIGFIGHEPLVYRDLTPLENLELFGRLYRVPERRERIGMLLERFGLWDVRRERVGTFSRGMQQRLGLARVLLHEPELLVLDEPFYALDAAGADLLDETLAELSSRAFVVATHDPERVERLSTERLAFA